MTTISQDEIDRELLPFLSKDSKPNVRTIALDYFLGLTGSAEGRDFIIGNPKYLIAIFNLFDDQPGIAIDALRALTNLSSDADIALKLLELPIEPSPLVRLVKFVLQPDSFNADGACIVLSNLSRPENCAKKIVQSTLANKEEIGLDKVIQVFCLKDFNPHANLHYLGPYLSNLTQIPEARSFILDKKKCVVQKLLPFTQFANSEIRRGGIIGTLRNCCFETAYHEWLLSDEVDILPRLLLPLCGPEEFDDEDMSKLPEDLQYLEPDKQREEDPDMRQMLVESVHQLCTTAACRSYIREKNTYVILRELDNWEKDPAAKLAIQKLVSLLINDEPEPGMENLKEVVIPEHISQKFHEADKMEIEEMDSEMEKLKQEN